MKRRKPSPAESAPRTPGGSGRKTSRLQSLLLACATAAFVICVVLGWLLWKETHGQRPPRVDTTRLDPAWAAVLTHQQELVKAAPHSGAAWGRLGTLLRALEFPDEARRCLAEAERLEPNEARWPYFQGLIEAVNSPAQAIPKLRRAAELCGTQPDAPRLRLARLLAESGQWEAAEEALQPLLRAEPGHGPALLLLAQAARSRGDLSSAVELSKPSAQDPRSARGATLLLAALQQRQGDTEAARTAEQTAAALPPDPALTDPFEAEVAAWRGDTREQSDRLQQLLAARRLGEAEPIAERLVRDHPGFAEGWLLLGRLRLLQNRPPEAEQAIRRHLQLEPGSAAGLLQLGMTFLHRQDFTQAASAFQQATQASPESGPAYFNLGVALARGGNKPEAVTALRQAIRLSPEHADSYFLLADLLNQLGRRQEALPLVRQAEAMTPRDPRLAGLKARLGL
jgi:tetratricopeptide (TPR) repeat protein